MLVIEPLITTLPPGNIQIIKRPGLKKELDEIDSAIITALSDKVTVMQQVRDSIITSLADPILISDPAALMRVQALMADYSLNIEMASKMAQKIVSTVDSLVKS